VLSPRGVVGAALVLNVAFYLLMVHHRFGAPLTMTLINIGFQALAGLCVYYARRAEDSRDQLALVNADLLATRALLADSARDAERREAMRARGGREPLFDRGQGIGKHCAPIRQAAGRAIER
jgi:hypothetical protein